MSASKDNATSAGSTSPDSSGGTKGACDRCRGQKLKCRLADESHDTSGARCVRCVKAGARCSFSVQKRAGRPRTSDATSSEEQKKHNDKRRRKRLLEKTVGHNSGECNRDLNSVPASSPSSPQTSETLERINLKSPDLLQPSEMPPIPYKDDAGEGLGIFAFDLENSWVLQDYQFQPMDLQTPAASPTPHNVQFQNIGASAHVTAPQRRSASMLVSDPSEEAAYIDMAYARDACISPFGLLKAPSSKMHQAADHIEVREDIPSNSAENLMSNGVLSVSLAQYPSKVCSKKEHMSAQESQDQRNKELCDLARDLYTQVANSEAKNVQSTSSATEAVFQDQLFGRVLKISISFRTLLDSFLEATNSSIPFSASISSQASPQLDHEILDHQSKETLIAPPLASAFYAESHGMGKESPLIDISTVLQLITCYLRIIHLHSNMYKHILDYLRAYSPSNHQNSNPIPPVLPGAQIGGVSLDKFGSFQVQLLLQISVNILRGIERTLGIPERYRVDKKKSIGRNILEANLSGGFMDCLMTEKSWRSQKIEDVRKHLGDLKRMLEGTIEI